MSTRTPPRAPYRIARTASEAFRDHTYGAAIEKPMPSFWRRVAQAIKEWL